MKKADILYLATDPDREGEAISWHLFELLKKRGVLKNKETHRVVFHADHLSKAVNDAVSAPQRFVNGYGECPASAPSLRLSGRLYLITIAMEKSTTRAISRPSSKSGITNDR
ncbi:MAG: toprim domain-containing protein [Gammaproteobacteria bacterium]|nr:toprim domain-containing protein [Gammaproteobacteria bacterium]